MMKEAQVLIVGAGPTGLVLALGFAKQGIPFRIIDKLSGPGEQSRAMAVHARTLEYYRQFGFADKVVDKGIPLNHVQIYKDRKLRTNLKFEDIGEGLSPFPFVLSLGQDHHEQILVKQLEEKGVSVEWNTELISFHQEKDMVYTVTVKDGVEETNEYSYLCGCDGFHSRVRKRLGFDFPGGTYKQVFYVADVLSKNPIDIPRMGFFGGGFGIAIPIRTRASGSLRLVGIVPETLLKQNEEEIEFAQIAPYIKENIGVQVNECNWFSIYNVHHRVSEQFREGRVFIAGDAGHVHSPAGAQGMNTGIGDAINLSWKIAAVLQEKANASILDSYETERRVFAKKLVDTTDKIFSRAIGEGFTSNVIRNLMLPYIAPVITGLPLVRKRMFKAASQIRINYRDSKFSEGVAGSIHGGDRLPWIPLGDRDNFKPLESFDWQIHVYGKAKPALRDFTEMSAFPLHEFPWKEEMKEAGIERDSFYLIRPDGYVALADAGQEIEKIKSFIDQLKINR